MSEQVLLGVDAGGTFTDFVCVRIGTSTTITIHKTPSTPDAPEQAIVNGIQALGLEQIVQRGELNLIHGSTVATNAVLEGKLARTVFITNYGFADMLTLARQTRPHLYALEFAPIPPPVPRALCVETGGRVAADGSVLEPLTETELNSLLDQVEQLNPQAVAINLLFSFLNDSDERRIETALQQRLPQVLVSRSSRILPEYKEYERGIATWLNAALGPVINGYLTRLQGHLGGCSLQIMQSSGDTIRADKAVDSAVNLLLSGPAGGLKAIQFIGQHLAEQAVSPKIISFDMGGTSTDVALIEGEVTCTTEGQVGAYPVAVAMVDMHTIGAGGGSIAFVDSGGMLQVGPQSAGAQPGPACYGNGGKRATVTDANLVLGRLHPDLPLAGNLRLDVAAATRVIDDLAQQLHMSVAETASGIVTIANELMAKAVRMISVNRGYDPDDFALACFGGAGGLHVCALAEAMQMRRAIVPVYSGVLSALGMVVANRGRQFSKTLSLQCNSLVVEAVDEAFAGLQQTATQELEQEGLSPASLHSEYSVDMRYAGQSYTLTVPWQTNTGPANKALDAAITQFHAVHRQRYGYVMEGAIEFVNIRLQVIADAIALALPSLTTDPGNNPAQAAVYPPEQGSNKRVSNPDQPAMYTRAALLPGETVFGPAIISEYSATTYVDVFWSARVDDYGNLLLTYSPTDTA